MNRGKILPAQCGNWPLLLLLASFSLPRRSHESERGTHECATRSRLPSYQIPRTFCPLRLVASTTGLASKVPRALSQILEHAHRLSSSRRCPRTTSDLRGMRETRN